MFSRLRFSARGRIGVLGRLAGFIVAVLLLLAAVGSAAAQAEELRLGRD